MRIWRIREEIFARFLAIDKTSARFYKAQRIYLELRTKYRSSDSTVSVNRGYRELFIIISTNSTWFCFLEYSNLAFLPFIVFHQIFYANLETIVKIDIFCNFCFLSLSSIADLIWNSWSLNFLPLFIITHFK